MPTVDSQMTVRELIEALQKVNPDNLVEIAVRQYNKAYPVCYLPMVSSLKHQSYQFDVKTAGNYTRLDVSLPYGAFVSKLPKW